MIRLLLFFLCLPLVMLAQVGINTQNPHPESDIHLASKNKTLILNHVDDFSKITDPYEGMLIYDYVEHCFRGYQQNGWSGCFGAKAEDPVISASGPGFKGTYVRGQQLTDATYEVTIKNNTFRDVTLGFAKEDLEIVTDSNIIVSGVYINNNTPAANINVNFPAGTSYTIIYKLTGTLNSPYTQLLGVWNKITLGYEDMQEIDYHTDCSIGTWISDLPVEDNGLLKNGKNYNLEYTVPIPNSEGYSFEEISITKNGLTLTREAVSGSLNGVLKYTITGTYTGNDAEPIEFGNFTGCEFNVGRYPYHCKEIKNLFPNSLSGVYTIDVDGENNEYKPFEASCDMETDGGGWTLVLNYNHLGGTSPELIIRNKSLPILGSTTLGVDESKGKDGTNPPIPQANTNPNVMTNSEIWATKSVTVSGVELTNNANWGHFSNALANKMSFNEIRFYGKGSSRGTGTIFTNDRIIHFKTLDSKSIDYLKTGIGSMANIKTNYTLFNGEDFPTEFKHTAYIPKEINNARINKGDYALTDFPFYRASANHWAIRSVGVIGAARWEVDDFSERESYKNNTYHQVWVR